MNSDEVQWLSCVRLFATLWAIAYQALQSMEFFQAQNTGVGCYFLLQEIFPTHGSNPGLPHCGQMLYHLSHQGRSAEAEAKQALPQYHGAMVMRREGRCPEGRQEGRDLQGALPCQGHLEREGGGGESAAHPPVPPPPATLQTRGQTPGQWPRRSTFFQFSLRPCRHPPTALMQFPWPILERLPGQPGL